jgi:predicted secreted acid phosphatase
LEDARLAVSTAENSLPNKDLSIVFDLDETLVFDDSMFREKNEKLVVPTKFNYQGREYNCDWNVIPGVYEMLQYVKIGNGKQIAFFSAGVKERNEALVPVILKNAFPNDHERILFYQNPRFSLVITRKTWKRTFN